MKSLVEITSTIPTTCFPELASQRQKNNAAGEDQIPKAKPLTDSDFLAKFSKLYQLELMNSEK